MHSPARGHTHSGRPAHLGTYELSWGEQVFHAHALPGSYAEQEEAVYHFVVEDEAGGEGELAGDESGESPEDHLEHHDLPELENGEEEPA